MKATQAEYKAGIARLAEDAAKRETRLMLATTGLIVGAVIIPGDLRSACRPRGGACH